MKKGKKYLPLILAASLCFSLPFASSVTWRAAAEESYEEETAGDGHQDAYYDEIQSNSIEGWPQGPQVEADAAIVIDNQTGAVLYSKNADKKEYPASITKIMTVLLALEKGNLSDTVTFSENAVYSIEFGSSHLGLTEGEELTMEQCLYGIMMASANEISNAVAEHIAGDIDTFVQMMNDKAAELGCTGTHFVNVHGLHDENHYVTAHDMALITREALKNEKFREIIGTVEYHYDETNLVDEKRYFMNHHKMLWEDGMVYEGCLGGKTGYTDEAWNTLVTAASRNGMELICVVLRVPGLYESYYETKDLLDYGYQNFKEASISSEGFSGENLEITGIEDQQERNQIQNADFSRAPFALARETVVTIPQSVDPASLSRTMNFTDSTLTYAYNGQPLGTSSFMYTGQWEPETEAQPVTETTAESETETEAGKQGIIENIKKFGNSIANGGNFLYNKIDEFIKGNTIAAAVIGAVLLFIFIPLLLVAVNRNRKYKKMMELREREMKLRCKLEEEIEKKSAAQVEAELRAEALQNQLEEEKKKRQRHEEEVKEIESAAGFYLDDETSDAENGTRHQESSLPGEPEDEYIEVPLEEAEKDGRLF